MVRSTVQRRRLSRGRTRSTTRAEFVQDQDEAGAVPAGRQEQPAAAAHGAEGPALEGGDRPRLRPRGRTRVARDALGAHADGHQLGRDFPHVVQAAKILRHRTDLKTGKATRHTVHVITDMTAREVSPQLIGRLARSQRGIEAVHHVRDTTFAEDASRSGPDTARKTWPRFETSRSTPCGTPATTAPLPDCRRPPTRRSPTRWTCSRRP
jgi:hypothetical protein